MTNARSQSLRLRPFAGESDFPAMAEVANAVFAADAMGWVRTPEHIQRDYAGFTNFDHGKDIIMAEVGGRLVGYVRTSHWTDENGVLAQGQVGFVHPAFRRQGVGGELLRWVEARQREVAQSHAVSASVHHVFVTEGEVDRAAMLQRAVYIPVRHFLRMERSTLDEIPDIPMPEGFEVRRVQQEHLRAIFDAHMDALRGHWGVAPAKPGDFERWKTLPTFQPQLWQVAWHLETDSVAGQVKPFINEEQNLTQNRRRGETEFISVGETWRRRGLASALIARALRAQRDAGMTESVLGVDADNPHEAARLYERCGFRVTQRNMVLRKSVHPE